MGLIRISALFLTLTVFFAAAAARTEAQPASSEGPNLLRNPGLESAGKDVDRNALPRFWDIYRSGRAPGSVSFSLTGDAVYEGRRALLIHISEPQAAGILQTADVEGDTWYRFSARVKTEALESNGPGVHLFASGANAAAHGFSGTSGAWGELVLFFRTAPGQTKASVAVLVGTADQPVHGRVWLDDTCLKKISGPPPAGAAEPPAAAAFEAAFPRPGAGFAVFIALSSLLFSSFIFLALRKKFLPHHRIIFPLLTGVLTVLYAFIAFFRLGSFDAPQTFYRAQEEGERFILDLGAARPVSRIMYYMALGSGVYRLDFSDDLYHWRDPKLLEQGLDNTQLQIHWRTENAGFKTRYLRVTAVRPGAMLGELAAFSDEDGSLLPILAVIPETGGVRPSEDPRLVCDEPGRVPFLPSYLNGTYFDECYFARSAYQYTLGMDSYEESHPPLGKLTMALGFSLFGFTPFGWRFMGALLGIIMIPIMYAFGLALFKNQKWAFIGAFLFAFDFMHFTQTRIATIDVFGVFWIMLMYLFMYRALEENPFTQRPGKLLLFLFLSGLCFGLGAASKWIALYGALGLAAALIGRFTIGAVIFFRRKEQERGAAAESAALEAVATAEDHRPSGNRRSRTPFFLRRTGLVFCFSVLVFIILPAAIYLASYIPFMTVRGKTAPHISPLMQVVKEQKLMYDFHAAQNSPHNAASPWYEWPIIFRPMWFYTGNRYLFHDTVSDIFSFGNPAVWWFGLAASGALFVLTAASAGGFIQERMRRLKKKSAGVAAPQTDGLPGPGRRTFSGLFILTAFAAQYLPWAVIPRTQTFIYHFFAAVPFLILAAVFILKTMAGEKRAWMAGVFIYLGIVMILFFLFYPILSGARADTVYVNGFLKWFPSWFPSL